MFLLIGGPPDSPFIWITRGITDLLTSKGDIFWAEGMTLFRGIAIILIVWYGVQAALASASGSAIRWDRLASFLITLAFGFAMIKYYNSPLPGVGVNFHKLITDEGANLAAQIDTKTIDDVSLRLANVQEKMEAPTGASLLDPGRVLVYYGILFLTALVQGVLLFVIGYGFIALGAIVLVGPIFIPFFLIPSLDRYFFGWLGALIQYAFYPVIANIFVYLFGHFLLNFLDIHPPPYDAATIAGLALTFMMMIIAFMWGILKVPMLVSSLFSGRSGDHAFPGIGSWR